MEETGQAKETWDEVLWMTERSLELILLTLRIVMSGEDVLRERLVKLVKQAEHSIEKNRL